MKWIRRKIFGYVVSMAATIFLLYTGKIPPDTWAMVCLTLTGMLIGGTSAEKITNILKGKG